MLIIGIIMEADLIGLDTREQPAASEVRTRAQENFMPFEETFRFTTDGMPSVISKKVVNLVNILNASVVNLNRLKECLAEGIPD